MRASSHSCVSWGWRPRAGCGARGGFRADLDLAVEFGMRTVVGIGAWYYTTFPIIPNRAAEWRRECDIYYAALEKCVRHAERIGVTIR